MLCNAEKLIFKHAKKLCTSTLIKDSYTFHFLGLISALLKGQKEFQTTILNVQKFKKQHINVVR
jgi:hypothetical protein